MAFGSVSVYLTRCSSRASFSFRIALVRRLDETAPADAVVLQDYDIEKVQWVSGFGGRRTPGNAPYGRASSTRTSCAAEKLVKIVYSGKTAQVVRRAAEALGADYVIVDTRGSQAPLKAGRVVDRDGPFVLVHMRAGGASP